MSSCDSCGTASRQLVVEFGKACPDAPDGQQLPWRTGNRARKEWFSFAQGNGRHLNNDLVEETGIVELTGKITTAHNPDVFSARGFNHLGVSSLDATLDEADVRARHARQDPVR